MHELFPFTMDFLLLLRKSMLWSLCIHQSSYMYVWFPFDYAYMQSPLEFCNSKNKQKKPCLLDFLPLEAIGKLMIF